jgi:hypothetical protein
VKLATIEDPMALARWLTIARANFPAPVELYVFAQGWELRCAQMRPYKIEHAPLDAEPMFPLPKMDYDLKGPDDI